MINHQEIILNKPAKKSDNGSLTITKSLIKAKGPLAIVAAAIVAIIAIVVMEGRPSVSSNGDNSPATGTVEGSATFNYEEKNKK